MKFEFDPEKSDRNKNKHEIDFVEAQDLWNDIDLLEIPAKTTDETNNQHIHAVLPVACLL